MLVNDPQGHGHPLRNDQELAAIWQAVEEAIPPAPEPLPLEGQSLFYLPDPMMRRAWRLSHPGRQEAMTNLAALVSDCTGTPAQLALRAMNAAVPMGREPELDDDANHLGIAVRAITAMGLDAAECLLAPVGRKQLLD